MKQKYQIVVEDICNDEAALFYPNADSRVGAYIRQRFYNELKKLGRVLRTRTGTYAKTDGLFVWSEVSK